MLQETAVENARAYIFEMMYKHLNPPLYEICRDVLDEFGDTPASGSDEHHHFYRGGLYVHTAEVLSICMGQCDVDKTLDRQALICAAVFHDYGKTVEYQWVDEHLMTAKFKNLVGHVAHGYAKWYHYANMMYKANNEQFIFKVGHILLSHHGKIEWRAVVEPVSPEAKLFHLADMMSSRFSVYKSKGDFSDE